MATKPVLTDLDFGNAGKVIQAQPGVADSDYATMGQLRAATEGNAWKDDVRAATTANLSLASPGATIDGVTMAVNDRVLVRAQTSQPENGIYIWNGAAVAMTRALDGTTFDELEGAVVSVTEGTTNAQTRWRQNQVNGVIGTNNVIWAADGSSAPAASETTAGIAELATQAETDTGTDDLRIVTPSKLSNWSGRIRRHVQTIGDGSATSIAVTHNLNTRDLIGCEVFQASGTFDKVDCEVELTSVNVATFKFNTAPASNALRVVLAA
jgi:hypothetical protein